MKLWSNGFSGMILSVWTREYPNETQTTDGNCGGDGECRDPDVPGRQLDSVTGTVLSDCGLCGPPAVSVSCYGDLQRSCEAGIARRGAAFVIAALPAVCLCTLGSAAIAPGLLPNAQSDWIAPGNDPTRGGEKCGQVSPAAFGRSVIAVMFLLNPREEKTRQRPGRRFLRSWRGRVDARRQEWTLRYGFGRTGSKAVSGPTLAESTT